MSKNSVTILSDIEVTVLAALEAAFNNMYNVTEACDYAGISRKTYYKYIEQVKGFSARMELAKSMPLRKFKEVVVKTASDGDANLAFKLLQARDPDFKPKAAIEFDPNEEKLEEIIKGLTNDPANKPDLSDDSEADQADTAE